MMIREEKHPPARILIDAHMVGEQEGGNETYILNLIRGLQQIDPPETFLLATAHPGALADKISAGKNFIPVVVSANPFRRLLVDLPLAARRHQAGLLHITYMAPPRPGVPFVATIHDVIYARHPDWFSLRDRLILKHGITSSLKRASAILTLSENSKRDLTGLLGADAQKVHPIHLAADERFFIEPPHGAVNNLLTRRGIQQPYVLAVGSLHPRKNIQRLIEAFGLAIQQQDRGHHLVVAGKAHWRESDSFNTVRALGLEARVTFTGYVSDDELPLLYRGADAFVYPSLYEGFGIPVLEAMASRVPVICSRTSSLPEVAGQAALLVDPSEPQAITRALMDLWSDKALAEKLRLAGKEQARRFSWAQTASATLAVYRQTLNAPA